MRIDEAGNGLSPEHVRRASGFGQTTVNAGLEQMPRLEGYGGPRTFTREEVNTVIRALKVEVDQTTERPVLERLRRIFERME